MARIVVNAADLRRVSSLMRGTRSDFEAASTQLRAMGLPEMPADVVGRISYGLGRSTKTLWLRAEDLGREAQDLDRRAERVEQDAAVERTLDALVWLSKTGGTILRHLVPTRAGLRWFKRELRWGGRAMHVLSVVEALDDAVEQFQHDRPGPHMSGARRFLRAVGVGLTGILVGMAATFAIRVGAGLIVAALGLSGGLLVGIAVAVVVSLVAAWAKPRLEHQFRHFEEHLHATNPAL